MDDKRLVKVSRYLSKHLRHQPDRLGLVLEPGGWVRVDDLLAACRRSNFDLTREQLDEVVAHNDKRRFSFDSSGLRIRANQGHSVEIDLELVSTRPPSVPHRGTAEPRLPQILREGLTRQRRHHVHLSVDEETAVRVGARRGRPVVLHVDAAGMWAEGHLFFLTSNGVWLVDAVPPNYLALSADL